MHILLNGKKTDITEQTTLLGLLEEMKIRPQMVACELNTRIVKHGDYASVRISEGDQIEILQMIGGG